jgi:hypothetical protein
MVISSLIYVLATVFVFLLVKLGISLFKHIKKPVVYNDGYFHTVIDETPETVCWSEIEKLYSSNKFGIINKKSTH